MGLSSATWWSCCDCGDAPQNISINVQCMNGQCQHIRCSNCRHYNDYDKRVDFNTRDEIERPDQVTDSPNDPSNGDQQHVAGKLGPASERLAFSVGGPLNAPALLGMSSELSESTRQRLDYLDHLKTASKTTMDEAIARFSKETGPQSYDRKETRLECYLQDLRRPSEFAFVWELSVLPFLVKVLPRWLGKGYAINVLRNSMKSSARIICFTSRIKPTIVRRIIIARHVLDILPQSFHDTTSFQFCRGRVTYLGSESRGDDKNNRDKAVRARNAYFYCEPMMGDSIGPSQDSCTGTLGPRIMIGDDCYWLSAFHVFINAWKKQNFDAEICKVIHPGLMDKKICNHAPLQNCTANRVKLGELCARSGDSLRTSRKTSHPYWQTFNIEPPEVVTDWVLISAATSRPNTLRIPRNFDNEKCPYITDTSLVLPRARICTTGRTSGYQHGHVCEIPAYLDADHDRRTAIPTREWFIERPQYHELSEDDWLEAGPGLPGDSGSPIIDTDTNELYGQLWGRNKYWGPGPRISYFTAISDTYLDIQDKYEGISKLELPQCNHGENTINFRLMCLYCGDSQANSTIPEHNEESSNEMSSMSLDIDCDNEEGLNFEAARSSPSDEHDLEWDQSEGNDIMSLNSDNLLALETPAVNSAVQRNSEEEYTSTDAEFDEAAVIDMIVDPAQYAIPGSYDRLSDSYGDYLEIDESEEDEYESNFLSRSCAGGKGRNAETDRHGKMSEMSSWVLVHLKSKRPAENPSKILTRRTTKRSPLIDAAKLLKGLTLKDNSFVHA